MITTEIQARAYIQERAGQEAIDKLETLARWLAEENSQQNLVSKGSLEQVWVRHFADSAQLLDYAPEKTSRSWLDLGSGAGFPGLVLAICRPSQPIMLVESRRKRVDWLTAMAETLELPCCEIAGMRLEQVTTFQAGLITARAFAPLEKLLDLSSRFSTKQTVWLLPKGRSARQEVEGLGTKTGQMFHVEQSLTDAEAGIIVGKGDSGAGL